MSPPVPEAAGKGGSCRRAALRRRASTEGGASREELLGTGKGKEIGQVAFNAGLVGGSQEGLTQLLPGEQGSPGQA